MAEKPDRNLIMRRHARASFAGALIKRFD